MNKYFQFSYKWLERPGLPITEQKVVGFIKSETESTVTVKFHLPNGEPQLMTFEKSIGIEFNHL